MQQQNTQLMFEQLEFKQCLVKYFYDFCSIIIQSSKQFSSEDKTKLIAMLNSHIEELANYKREFAFVRSFEKLVNEKTIHDAIEIVLEEYKTLFAKIFAMLIEIICNDSRIQEKLNELHNKNWLIEICKNTIAAGRAGEANLKEILTKFKEDLLKIISPFLDKNPLCELLLQPTILTSVLDKLEDSDTYNSNIYSLAKAIPRIYPSISSYPFWKHRYQLACQQIHDCDSAVPEDSLQQSLKEKDEELYRNTNYIANTLKIFKVFLNENLRSVLIGWRQAAKFTSIRRSVKDFISGLAKFNMLNSHNIKLALNLLEKGFSIEWISCNGEKDHLSYQRVYADDKTLMQTKLKLMEDHIELLRFSQGEGRSKLWQQTEFQQKALCAVFSQKCRFNVVVTAGWAIGPGSDLNIIEDAMILFNLPPRSSLTQKQQESIWQNSYSLASLIRQLAGYEVLNRDSLELILKLAIKLDDLYSDFDNFHLIIDNLIKYQLLSEDNLELALKLTAIERFYSSKKLTEQRIDDVASLTNMLEAGRERLAHLYFVLPSLDLLEDKAEVHQKEGCFIA